MPKYQPLPVEVEAIQVKYQMLIQLPEGAVSLYPGDWLVITSNGDQIPFRNEVFQQLYEPVSEGYGLERFYRLSSVPGESVMGRYPDLEERLGTEERQY